MENRIPIDDLFRDVLSQGKEQINLGAWANMERMLDGKNPYRQEESKKKRRILPIIGFIAAVGTILSGAYFALNGNKKESAGYHQPATTQTQPLAQTLPVSSPDPSITAEMPLPQAYQNEPQQTKNASSSSSNESSNHLLNAGQSNNQASHKIVNRNNDDLSASNSTSNNTQKQSSTPQSGIISDPVSNNLPEKFSAEKAKNKKSKSTNKNLSKNAESKNQNDNILSKTDPLNSVPSANTVVMDTIPGLQLVEKVTRNKNGHVVSKSYDTIGSQEILVEKSSTRSNVIPINPRMVALSPEEEAAANRKIDLTAQSNSTMTVIASNTANSSLETMQIAHKNQDLSIAKTAEKGKERKQDSWFDQMQNIVQEGFQKLNILSMRLMNMNIPFNPGISLGVNASLFNTKHNFGGFHAGFTNTLPLSEYFSMMTELKFFYRNNSGYTVSDASTTIRNHQTDTISMASSNQNVYTYQVDSNVKIYNFKHVMSLELPIYMQAHLSKFTLYGGVNFAYNFRLNVKQIKRDFIINGQDIREKSEPYKFPVEKGSQFSRDDFSSRFGIGYSFGAAYSFNPNLYVDFRLTQNVWDNTNTNAARSISNGFFKVPSLQFSIGYRFKKFDLKE
ncbi:MAG TPA: hypothetical protein DCF44_00005, partial [Chitinophagaceae bacterium]|nr:hypothetical protein [Chitinophagaceae bacterium]